MMKTSLLPILVVVSASALLSACGVKPFKKKPYFVTKSEPWRARDERLCLSSGAVRVSPFVVQRSALRGPKTCGALKPFYVKAALGGRVRLKPAATLGCPMVPAFERWVAEVANPAARRIYGQPIVEIKVAASYACRPMNSKRGAKLSEHGHANAIDISKFILADGTVVTVKAGWWGRRRDSRFLRQIHKGGCSIFYTVLGPSYNKAHHDHFHLDLARHGRSGSYRVCR